MQRCNARTGASDSSPSGSSTVKDASLNISFTDAPLGSISSSPLKQTARDWIPLEVIPAQTLKPASSKQMLLRCTSGLSSWTNKITEVRASYSILYSSSPKMPFLDWHRVLGPCYRRKYCCIIQAKYIQQIFFFSEACRLMVLHSPSSGEGTVKFKLGVLCGKKGLMSWVVTSWSLVFST